MFALDVLGGTIQSTGLGFDEGDADRPCLPVPGSLFASPWLGPDVAQLQVQMLDHDGQPFYGDPRQVLDRVLERYALRGWRPVVAIELEFYFVDPERTGEGHAQRAGSALQVTRAGAETMRALRVSSPRVSSRRSRSPASARGAPYRCALRRSVRVG
jgi:glutamine synthetase